MLSRHLLNTTLVYSAVKTVHSSVFNGILVYCGPSTYISIINQLIFHSGPLCPPHSLIVDFSTYLGKLYFSFYFNCYRKCILAACTDWMLLQYLTSCRQK